MQIQNGKTRHFHGIQIVRSVKELVVGNVDELYRYSFESVIIQI